MKKMIAAIAALALVATPAMAQNDRRIQVVNHSGIGQPVTAIYIQNPRGAVTEIMRGYPIPAGYNRIINFTDGTNTCIYNIEAHFSNGTYARRDRVNVCTTLRWNLFDIDNTLEAMRTT